MNNKEKRARFRELAKHDRIRTGRQLAEELEQPFLPFNECKAVVSQENRADTFPQAGRWRHQTPLPKGFIAERASSEIVGPNRAHP